MLHPADVENPIVLMQMEDHRGSDLVRYAVDSPIG